MESFYYGNTGTRYKSYLTELYFETQILFYYVRGDINNFLENPVVREEIDLI